MDEIIGDCPDCLLFWETLPVAFIAALGQVAPDYGLTAKETMVVYVAAYHVRGHRPMLAAS